MLVISLSLMLLAADAPVDKEMILKEEQAIESRFQSEVHIASLPFKPEPPSIHLNTTPMISYTDKSGVHEAVFEELPPPFRDLFDHWASFTSDQPSGHALFDEMFHKFFYVHELGHWTTAQVLDVRRDIKKHVATKNAETNLWEAELETNRIAVAWWRENDPAFLAKLIGDFRRIQAALPNPVPPGADMKTFFATNYEKLGRDPNAYGWFLLQSVILAYDEPQRSFQQTLDALASYNFD